MITLVASEICLHIQVGYHIRYIKRTLCLQLQQSLNIFLISSKQEVAERLANKSQKLNRAQNVLCCLKRWQVLVRPLPCNNAARISKLFLKGIPRYSFGKYCGTSAPNVIMAQLIRTNLVPNAQFANIKREWNFTRSGWNSCFIKVNSTIIINKLRLKWRKQTIVGIEILQKKKGTRREWY